MGTRNVVGVGCVIALVVSGGCGSDSARITAATTCADYLAFDDQARGAAVRTIGVEQGWRDAGNPMAVLSFDAHCAQRGSQTVEQALGLFAGNQSGAPVTTVPAETESVPAGGTVELSILVHTRGGRIDPIGMQFQVVGPDGAGEVVTIEDASDADRFNGIAAVRVPAGGIYRIIVHDPDDRYPPLRSEEIEVELNRDRIVLFSAR